MSCYKTDALSASYSLNSHNRRVGEVQGFGRSALGLIEYAVTRQVMEKPTVALTDAVVSYNQIRPSIASIVDLYVHWKLPRSVLTIRSNRWRPASNNNGGVGS